MRSLLGPQPLANHLGATLPLGPPFQRGQPSGHRAIQDVLGAWHSHRQRVQPFLLFLLATLVLLANALRNCVGSIANGPLGPHIGKALPHRQIGLANVCHAWAVIQPNLVDVGLKLVGQRHAAATQGMQRKQPRADVWLGSRWTC